MYADILILAALLQGPKHGYEIKKRYDEVLEGLVTLHHNQLYPTLRRFEENGAVRCETVSQRGKPDRIIYHLTEQGFALFRDIVRDFPHTIAKSDMEFYVRYAFFGFLDPADRLAILQTRSNALKVRLRENERIDEYLAPTFFEQVQPYVDQLRTLRGKQIREELQWLSAQIAHLS
ncbi:PadR family transcriptional regulator [Ktedonosporobacter rubrisoli]|uniref:PadR family transcriptional regulator n=1 Tax=Ktedonosporobacter rubrisoli TaxID=2509675 RepID=A0A4V0YYD0_KTERU|nr:PadR family transcriptional regulator [Ktedonosporobacter rubrisoli]QBD75791.1 PadR family transcriptional regulator [Ktedonosporobacter rubrisoli]